MRDLRHAKPGEVYRDRDGDVWGVLRDGHAAIIVFRDASPPSRLRKFRRDDRALADFGPFVLLTPEDDAEW